jgi:hypothetical protein
VLLTRGRTGSTAILDELEHVDSFCVAQELFTVYPFEKFSNIHRLLPSLIRVDKRYHKILPPFDIVKQHNWLWKRLAPNFYKENRQAYRYLITSEVLAQNLKAKVFCFKVLSNHFEERPYLAELLKANGYNVIYLRRRIAPQVISGMVANQSGKYNTLDKTFHIAEGLCKYHIDIDQFKWHLQWEAECIQKDIAHLRTENFDFIEVNYEDFCDDRESFYRNIFNFIGMPHVLPPPSNFVKMIQDPRLVIENFDEVVKAAAELGEVL